MNGSVNSMVLKAIVIGNDIERFGHVLRALSARGIAGSIEQDPQAVLDSCAVSPPDLVIAAEQLAGMTGIRFLSQLVAVAWTTSTILIADEEEDLVHDKTEGLGILGSIRNTEDSENLERLLDRFIDMKRSALSEI
jgi:DNA-binding response OmpR family regulator